MLCLEHKTIHTLSFRTVILQNAYLTLDTVSKEKNRSLIGLEH